MTGSFQKDIEQGTVYVTFHVLPIQHHQILPQNTLTRMKILFTST